VYHWHRKLLTRQSGEQWRIAHTRWEFHNLFLFILVLCCQGVICQFVRNVAMNRSIYNHAECFMRRFKLKISAFGTCQNNHASINRNKLWNSHLVCVIRHCSPACLVHNFRCQWYTVTTKCCCAGCTGYVYTDFIWIIMCDKNYQISRNWWYFPHKYSSYLN
jgi:hypothetical protein